MAKLYGLFTGRTLTFRLAAGETSDLSYKIAFTKHYAAHRWALFAVEIVPVPADKTT